MTGDKVLLIDDEIDGWYMGYYVEAFRQGGFEVTTCSSVEKLKSIQGDGATFSHVGIDLVMPPGSYGADATGEGMKTGLTIHHELSELWPEATFFFLTNAPRIDLLEEALRAAPVFEKIDYPPRKLVEEIAELHRSRSVSRVSRDWK